jgi:hypothetical protein
MAADLTKMSSKAMPAILALLAVIWPQLASSQALPDPTRPPLGLDTSGLTAAVPTTPPKGLQSVILSDAYCAAIFDGSTIKLGEKYGTEMLLEITELGVFLQGIRGRRFVPLFPGVGKQATRTPSLEKQTPVCKISQHSTANNPAYEPGTKEKK